MADIMAALEAFRGTNDLRFVEVPELGEGARIYYPRVPKTGDWVAIQNASKAGQGAFVFECLLRLARDEQGRRLFGEHKRKWLMEVMPGPLMTRIVSEMDIAGPDEIGPDAAGKS